MIEQIFHLINIGEELIIVILIALMGVVALTALYKMMQILILPGQFSRRMKQLETQDIAYDELSEKKVYDSIILFLHKNRVLSPEALQELYDAQNIQIRQRLHAGLSMLATIGSNAPFIGLFGTVIGVMTAFNHMGVDSGASNNMIMHGISTALIATAMGLLASLPAIISFNFLKKSVSKIMGNIEVIFKTYLAFHINQELISLKEYQEKGGKHGSNAA